MTLSQYQYLVPPHLREHKPSFFIVGGLVFISCSGAVGGWWLVVGGGWLVVGGGLQGR